uniref:NADH-ubiquinone oxidoreductase chain 2 n=1 Tax=Liodrosophila aerea TaxID=7295 RepID=A0A678MY91_9MUSC|nr:NADH dehydrogenase subunit 2 [Liodrosophila aerea]
MLNNSSKILFLMMMMIGTMITVTSNSWLGAWMGLEINLLSFIPLMSDNNNFKSTEASLKYFLTQALASTVLLFSVILLMLKNNMNNEINESFTSMIMMCALLLKSGAAPFHFWFPNLMEGLTWMNALMLMTWQKIAPLMLISYLNSEINNKLLLLSVILSVTVGALGGLNQTSLRKLMAFSSINHLGWMISALMINESIWFLIYSFGSFVLIYMFNSLKTYHPNQLFSWVTQNKMVKFTLFFNFLSLGGLPPFLGFFPKWMVIQQLTFMNQYFLLMILLMTTLITLFFYLRICFSAFMLNYSENNWIMFFHFNSTEKKIYLNLSYISIFGMLLITLFFFML